MKTLGTNVRAKSTQSWKGKEKLRKGILYGYKYFNRNRYRDKKQYSPRRNFSHKKNSTWQFGKVGDFLCKKMFKWRCGFPEQRGSTRTQAEGRCGFKSPVFPLNPGYSCCSLHEVIHFKRWLSRVMQFPQTLGFESHDSFEGSAHISHPFFSYLLFWCSIFQMMLKSAPRRKCAGDPFLFVGLILPHIAEDHFLILGCHIHIRIYIFYTYIFVIMKGVLNLNYFLILLLCA